ncbi:hypothetical protein VZH09_13850 (plasmid) [Synechococcus elongatus IITB7]|uniref:hypothetical protein n=1 Tax=Synechococcus elongatus TaxID=32046 RepID=UPI0030D564E2
MTYDPSLLVYKNAIAKSRPKKTSRVSRFQPGQIVKHGHGIAAHYGIVLSDNLVVGWTTNSSLEPKTIVDFPWEAVEVHGESYSFDQIKANIRDFRDSLEDPNPPQYHLTEFNCEHWATLMVTGKSYSTQSGAVKIGTAEIVGGAMVIGGASAGTVVTIASTVGAAASTGTAISALSGAAASNAAMAWLGGGAVAAGGGGIAAGSAILSAVSTGGAIIAVAGVGVITKKVWDNLNESQRQEIINTLDQAAVTTLSVTGQVLGATVSTTAAVASTALSATAIAADLTIDVTYKAAKKLARGLGLW